MSDLRINDQLTIPEDDLEWSFARSSGPGGQNVNKVNSKATLRWRNARQRLAPNVWNRFQTLAKRYVTADGTVLIQSQEHRDQPQNIDACRTKLMRLIRSALVAPKRRIKTKPSRASQRRRLENKRHRSEKKKSRGRISY